MCSSSGNASLFQDVTLQYNLKRRLEGNQISKYRFGFTVVRMVLLEFSSFTSIRYIICFQVKYNIVTDTLNCVITVTNLYLNLLVANLILLWVAI